MQRILILGAGGHALVVADTLLRAREAGDSITPIGFLDDDPVLKGHMELGLPVLGTIADLPNIAHDAVIVAIGDNPIRRRLFEQLRRSGERFGIARHPAAVLAANIVIGPGTMISAGAVISPGSIIGSNVILNTSCTVDHHSTIADHAHIAPGAHLGGSVVIGEGTLVGIGAIVMHQREIGARSVVGAGALVHSNIPDDVVVFGVPATIIRRTTEN